VIDPTNHRKAPLISLGTMRADDGNRTRTTSLEGFECSGNNQLERRSGYMSVCPPMTVNPLALPSDRACNGHVPVCHDSGLKIPQIPSSKRYATGLCPLPRTPNMTSRGHDAPRCELPACPCWYGVYAAQPMRG